MELDREAIKRALINLLDNAVAACKAVADAGGRIEVVTTHLPARGVVRLEVADNGCGMSREVKLRLFEPYFSTKKEGTGLGLAIVSAIVADHQAYIRVQDNQPRGSRFIIDFPLRGRREADAHRGAGVRRDVMATVLVVDDEPQIRTSLRGILAEEGLRVLEAEDGRQALDVIQRENPELVILDIWMPEVDGLQVLQQLHGDQPAPAVIMISGHGNIETAVKATKLGAFDFIEKPFSLDGLLRVVNRALDHHAAVRRRGDATAAPPMSGDDRGDVWRAPAAAAARRPRRRSAGASARSAAAWSPAATACTAA